jgi:tetratricopeptide (TPR) repeat protein
VLTVTTAVRSQLYNDPVKLWRQTAAAVPNNSRALEQLGLALFTARTPNYALAESAFVRALAMDSSCQSGCLQYGTLLTKTGRYAEATPLLERQTVQGNGTKYNLLANKILALDWMKLGKYDKAIPCLERVVQIDPTLSHFVALGVSYLSAGRRQDAIDTFRYMATFDPANSQLQQLSRRLEDGASHPEALANLQEFAFTMTKGWI